MRKISVFLHFFTNHHFCGAFYCFVVSLTYGPLASAVRSDNIVFVKPHCKVIAKSPKSEEQMFLKSSCLNLIYASSSHINLIISLLPGPHKCNLR